MNETLLVITNFPDTESATEFAQQIVKERAAACINQLAPCISTYRWQDKIESATEVPLLIKTTHVAYPRLEKMIIEAHPYELPEIVAVPLTAGLPEYLSWIDNETTITKE